MFQDHAVLQRDRPIAVWGKAASAETLVVTFGDHSASAQADDKGDWKTTLPAISAGGPYTLSVRGSSGAAQHANDVLVGDVYLCSGQSNMGMQVSRSADSYNEVANSANDSIRMMNVGLAIHTAPLDEFPRPVKWQPASPATVPEFSAACFFFARELQKSVKVPLGLINSAWGGSKIEAWMSDRALRSVPFYTEKLDILDTFVSDPDKGGAVWGAMWESWWHSRPQTRGMPDPWSPRTRLDDSWKVAPPQLGHWEKWGAPELEKYTGMLWYRTTVKLTAQQAKQRAQLSIGQADEVDQTWVNGRPVGNTTGFGGDPHGDGLLQANRERLGPARVYYLPKGELKAGDNVIVVNVLDTWGLGGLYGSAEQRGLFLEDGTRIAFDGEWRYRLPPTGLGSIPRAPWEAVAGLTSIRNAMIAPIGNYGLRGALWYQGESNTDQADRYEALLRALMADWRAQFNPQMSFLIVQLANFGAASTAPVESGWAALREAQRLAVNADGNAGLAVAVDIGDRYDIHPTNKQEVGRRLARAARHVVYGEAIAPSGPAAVKAEKSGPDVVVTFADVAERLVAYSATDPIGFELCGPAANSCRYVQAHIEGHSARLDATDFPDASRVRYCWADSPVCTLYDTSTLPAGPFELTIGASAQRTE